MPIYEYQCLDCGRKSSFLLLRLSEPFEPTCKHCKSVRLTKLISRVNVVKSEESRLESLADPSKFGDLDEKDPKSVARFVKRMGKELGEDAGEDFDQMVDEAMEKEDLGEGEL
jgi:putative FmdB family regulatory protein